MAGPGLPLFLERGSYRRRRIMDMVRLVSVLGAILWMMPLLWPTETPEAEMRVSMSHALYYVFGVWILLIVLAKFLASRIRKLPPDAVSEEAGQ